MERKKLLTACKWTGIFVDIYYIYWHDTTERHRAWVSWPHGTIYEWIFFDQIVRLLQTGRAIPLRQPLSGHLRYHQTTGGVCVRVWSQSRCDGVLTWNSLSLSFSVALPPTRAIGCGAEIHRWHAVCTWDPCNGDSADDGDNTTLLPPCCAARVVTAHTKLGWPNRKCGWINQQTWERRIFGYIAPLFI